MKTRITLLIGAVALITLSFTFAGVDSQTAKPEAKAVNSDIETPVGGLLADEVAK